jgi:hypothetical protein
VSLTCATVFPKLPTGFHTLGLSQLRPGDRYRCEGTVEAEVGANAEGRASVTVELIGRREVRAWPVA